MKSSVNSSMFGFLPWSRTPVSKCDTATNSMITRSSVESDKMKEKVFASQHSQKRQQLHRKMSPLLRLNSQGEIAKGKFCDRSFSSQSYNKLGISKSFDYNPTPEPSASRSIENHIPHPSFKKSNSVPANVRMPAHQSFPPPSSSISAIRGSFSCPMVGKLSPFSSSPRLLGCPDVFGCAMSSISCEDCEKNRDVENFHPSDSKFNLKESKVACNTNDNMMASEKLDVIKKEPLSDRNDREKAVTSPVNCVKFVNYCCQSSSGYSSVCSVNCCDDKDPSPVPHKTKRKRPSRSKRKRLQNQKQGKDNDKSSMPSSSNSPASEESKEVNSSSSVSPNDSKSKSVLQCLLSPIDHITPTSQGASACQITNSSPRPRPCSIASNFVCLANSDSDLSKHDLSDDDLVFDDSLVFAENTPTSHTKKSLKKRKCRQKQSQKGEAQKSSSSLEIFFDASDVESDNEEKNSSLSGLRFTLSVSLSEDEDNDSSVDWDLSTSPSTHEPFIFELEFNTGLSLEDIIGGQNAATDCSTSQELRAVNKKWNKFYAPASFDQGTSQCQQKVSFAGDEDLVTVHIVGNEDRGGEWQRYAVERAQFQNKIAVIEKVVAPVLNQSHRAKMYERIMMNECMN